MNTHRLPLFLTVEHECGYLPDHRAANLVPDPQLPMTMSLYSQLIQHGYRRSGNHVYRPHCPRCKACIACRIPVKAFHHSRNQRRCYQRNRDLSSRIVNAVYRDEYFNLYQQYLHARHHDGSMANPEKADFEQFLYADWSDTMFIEVRDNKRLLAIAVCDITRSGLSAVYTFFDPEEKQRSLGTYCILLEIEQCKKMQLDYLYMGYWIENCQKMHYKNKFKPMMFYHNNGWVIKCPAK